MRIFRFLFFGGVLFLGSSALYAQNYLQKAIEYLDAGDCDMAKLAYDNYKLEHPQGNAEVERRIEKCKGDSPTGISPTATTSPANQEFTVNGIAFNMVYVEGGTFTMGCTSEQGNDCDGDERPAHKVTLSGFYMGETEVTQGLWRAVMDNEPYSGAWTDEYGRGISYPAYSVSWDDCQEFVRKLNRLASDQLPAGWHFALPTEAQWEYAARGGNQSRGYKYSGSNNIEEVAWFWRNSGDRNLADNDSDLCWQKLDANHCKIHPVKRKQPNALGLYDMSGNVVEWCKDVSDDSYYEVSPSTNPQGPVATEFSGRVLRGGAWCGDARGCRVSARGGAKPHFRCNAYGFRLVLVQQ